jgi:hypothetical protein
VLRHPGLKPPAKEFDFLKNGKMHHGIFVEKQ